jgi:putative tryptophan/tyrosine transport system substrate-binding protein
MLVPAYTKTDPEGQARLAAFLDTFQKLGWSERRNVRIDYRWGGGDADRDKAATAELARSAPDVIVVSANPTPGELQPLTRTIPIVFTQVSDPVRIC